VNNRTTKRRGAVALSVRIGGLLLATAMLVPMGIATRLQPSRSGMGTHHQLGLPPCSMRLMFGMRCPSCGMTTSWAHLADGNLWAAAESNVGGASLAFFAAWLVTIGMRTTWTGRFPSNGTLRRVTVVMIAIATVTLVDWLVRLVAG